VAADGIRVAEMVAHDARDRARPAPAIPLKNNTLWNLMFTYKWPKNLKKR